MKHITYHTRHTRHTHTYIYIYNILYTYYTYGYLHPSIYGSRISWSFFLTSRFNIRFFWFFLCILRWSIAADPWVIAASSCWSEPVTFCCGCRRRITPSAAVRGLPCWVRTKWLGYNGKSYSNGWFGGTPILGSAKFWDKSKWLFKVNLCWSILL